MARCLVQLSNTQKNNLRRDLATSEFSFELRDYYSGLQKEMPDLSVLAKLVNDEIIPTYFAQYKLQDLHDFLHDPNNSAKVAAAIGDMMSTIDFTNPQGLDDPEYVQNIGKVLEYLRLDATNRLKSADAEREGAVEEAEAIDSSSTGVMNWDDYKYQFLRKYNSPQAYRKARFRGSATTEIHVISKFINEVLLKNALINTETKELVSPIQIPGVFGKEGAPIDYNLKEYRKALLRDLVSRLEIHEIKGTQNVKVEPDETMFEPARFVDTLKSIEQAVNSVVYKGERVLLSDEGVLVQISGELKNTNDPELKKIIDNYVDFVILADFDKLFDYYTEGSIHVSETHGDFDTHSRKYGIAKVQSLDAINVQFDEKVHNGVELSPELYKSIIEVTPMLSYVTGTALNQYLYPALVSEIMSKYESKIDPRRDARSVKKVMIDALNDTNNSFQHKDVLYTLYKKFFEEPNDKLNLPKKNTNTTIASFMDTLADYNDKSLLQVILKPIVETKKVFYAEATEINREVAIVQSNTKQFTTSNINALNDVTTALNKSKSDLDKLFDKYSVQFKTGLLTYKTPNTDMTYELKPTGATAYSKETIMSISKDLVGIDFFENNAHKEFLQDLESRALGSEQLPNTYLAFLYDAFKIAQAKHMMYDPAIQKTIVDKGVKAEFSGSEALNTAIKSGDFRLGSEAEVSTNVLQLHTVASEAVYAMLAEAENRYAGNRYKSTVMTPENTTVAGFSTHTYFLGLNQYHQIMRDTINSVDAKEPTKSPLSQNLFIRDPNLLIRPEVRSAVKVGTIVKSNPSMSAVETMTYNVDLGYFDRMYRDHVGNRSVTPMFDILTYSDKTTNYLPVVSNNFLGQKLFIDNGIARPEDLTRQLHFDSVGHYYRAFANNIIDTWQAIYSSVSPDAGNLISNMLKDVKKPSVRLQRINDINAVFWNKPENFQDGLSGFNAARFYADKAGVKLNNWVHYQNDRKSIDNDGVPLMTKSALIKYVGMFDDVNNRLAYNKYMDDLMVESVKDLMEMGYSLGPQAIRAIARFYPNLENSFKSEGGVIYLTKGNKVPSRASDINPAFRKYVNDFNLVAENLTLASVGSPYAHKGDTPFKAWTTQNKRNVMATASMRKYTPGLETGVENETRTAFIDDFTTALKTILGEIHGVVDMDGASLETVTQRLKTYNSLTAQYTGDGGPDHKSIFVHFDPKTGEAGLTKHAAFQMDYDMIRNSQGSDIDLMELHKKLYATDISKLDITKSYRSDINLSDFQNEPVYYWDRSFDYKKGQAGFIYKLESIKYAGRDASGESLYVVKSRNMSLDPNLVITNKMNIKTMYDLWKLLGSIDSVSTTEAKTGISYMDGTKTIYLKPSITSAEKLLNYEAFHGNGNESILHKDYIRGNTKNDVQGWIAYQKLFDTDGVVDSHIDLISSYIDQDPTSFDVQNELSQRLYDFDVKVGSAEFLKIIQANKPALTSFFRSITDKKSASKGIVAFNPEYSAPYQRLKGKNVDRLSFAGAQKLGQFNMNNTSVLSKSKLAEFVAKNPVHLDKVDPEEWSHEAMSELVKVLDEDAFTGARPLTPEEKTKQTEVLNAVKSKYIKVPGVTQLLTHGISNLNGGVQLNAWHDAENATVTAPTQMLNALIFNGKSIEDVSSIYKAIGDIVDANLTYALKDPDLIGKQRVNIPQMVRGLSNSEFYAKNKETLLKVFQDMLQQSVKDSDFTLENTIKETFNHANLPIDDPHIFQSAVADLANYFTKNGIRINFDGIFAVLAPSSGILQFHDVKGGVLPIKGINGALEYRILPDNKITTLNKENFKRWNDYRAHIEKNPTQRLESASNGIAMDTQPRDLKGQQITLQYEDGRVIDLSILRKGQSHLIPEAEALSAVKDLIETYKKVPKSTDYGKQTPDEKISDLEDAYAAFKFSFGELINPESTEYNKNVHHIFKGLSTDYLAVDSKAGGLDLIDYINDSFGANKAYRQQLKERYLLSGQKGKLALSSEYDYYDKLNQLGKAYLGKLQNFLDTVATGVIPASLTDENLFPHAKDIAKAKIVISRAEVVAPITAKTSFLLRDGDTISDVDAHFFYKRLVDKLDYYDVPADGLLLSKHGRRVFLHQGRLPKSITPTPNTRLIGETTWYVDQSDNPQFIIPKGVTIANIGGEIHAYVKGDKEVDILKTSLQNAYREDGDSFKAINLGVTPAEKQALKDADLVHAKNKSEIMWNSWQKYLNVIGTRIPGQHFQSFQGMKIVGFTEGNKIHVPNEITLLSGSDFDIDKQNVIYHSITKDGTIALWHPAARYDNVETIEQSLQLPLQLRRVEDDFIVRKDVTGKNIDMAVRGIQDDADLTDLHVLLDLYKRLDRGERLSKELHPTLIATLVKYDNFTEGRLNPDDDFSNEVSTLNNGVQGIKNFTIARTNNTIENPSNFIYLSKPVSMDVPALFADNSPKGEAAKRADPHKPNSIASAKLDNMVGKKVIGIMATGLKVFSAVSLTYNNELRKLGPIVKEYNDLKNSLVELQADPIANQVPIQNLTDAIAEYDSKINFVVKALSISNLPMFKIPPMVKTMSAGNFRDLATSLPPNLNYDKISSEVLYEVMKRFQTTGGVEARVSELLAEIDAGTATPLKLKNHLRVKGTFEADAAEIMSQLLSAATDNAKELILGKINASPELAGLYATAIMFNFPFEQIVDLMTSDTTEMLLRNGSNNVFDRKTKDNSISKLLSLADSLLNPPEGQKKERRAFIKKILLEQYGLQETNIAPFYTEEDGKTVRKNGIGLKDIRTGKLHSIVELNKMKHLSDAGKEVALLGRMLSINQGVKSNTWDLYRFKTSLEDHIGKGFDMKQFLDSLAGDGGYAKDKIAQVSEDRTTFNILYVLSTNPHFAEQLKAYNAAHTILGLSSYKVNSASRIVQKLRTMNFLSEAQNVNKKQYDDIERFIENSIIENFIDQETAGNKNPNSAPVFYDGDKKLTLTSPERQKEFADWVRDTFLPRIKDSVHNNNDFVNGLTVDTKRDAQLHDKYSFVKLKVDTTNAQSLIQKSNKENYAYGLKLLYDSNATDTQHADTHKQNNIVNVLFWYNLVLNKNNITKNSYALMLGEVMGLGATKDNPYRRLLEFKGNIGKNELNHDIVEGHTLLMSNGITFDLMDLFKHYDSFGDIEFIGAKKRRGEDEELLDELDPEQEEEMIDDPEPEPEAEVEPDVDMSDDLNNFDQEDDGEGGTRPARVTISKKRVANQPGTQVTIKSGDNVIFPSGGRSGIISTLSSLIPHSSQIRSKFTFHTRYNPLDSTRAEVNDRDAINYQKMLHLTMHELLSNLVGKLPIQIIQRDSDGNEQVRDFDPTQTYECI